MTNFSSQLIRSVIPNCRRGLMQQNEIEKTYLLFITWGPDVKRKSYFFFLFSPLVSFVPVMLSRCHYWPSSEPPPHSSARPSVLARPPVGDGFQCTRSLVQRDTVASRCGGSQPRCDVGVPQVWCGGRPSVASDLE